MMDDELYLNSSVISFDGYSPYFMSFSFRVWEYFKSQDDVFISWAF